MSNRTIDRLREIYIQRNNGIDDFGWKNDPNVGRGGSQRLFIRNPDSTITLERYERGERYPDEIYPSEEAVVADYADLWRLTEEAFK